MSKFLLPLVFVLVLSLTVSPQMALAAPGDFIVADSNGPLLRVTPGGTVSVITSGGLGGPIAVAIDSAGNFIVTDVGGLRLLKVTPGGVVSVIASSGLVSPFYLAIEPQPQPQPIGGELLPIDSTALLLAGLQTSAIWMLPILAGAAGVGAFYIKTRMNKDN